jgi:hypothetical protein
MRVQFCTILGISLFSNAIATAECPYLLKDGKCGYTVVVGAAASSSEKHAAEELRDAFNACAGIGLTIAESAPQNGPMIVIGCGDTARKLGVDPKPDQLGEQGYVIKTVGPHLVIAGTPIGGTLYGVYDFLESVLGVRWYAPGVTKTPQTKELVLPALDKTFKPAFLWRNTSCWSGRDADFSAHVRDNSGRGGPDNPRGIQYAFDGTCHSYFTYVSPGEFWEKHPEYFSEIGGQRRSLEPQLCLANPDVLEIVTERMLKRMAAKPECRQHNFSQMDYYNACECPRCKAINEKYGTPGGTQYWFLNQLAERTSKQFPNKLIGTLAYMYTEEPPKGLKMHPNVAVWLCHMFPSCDSHPIVTCPLNAEYKRRAREWSKICSHLYVWHYIVNFAHLYNPFPNLGGLAEDIRFYRDLGAEGIYLQGWGGGEFHLLRPYYAMKLLWNPDQNAGGVMRDFLEGYYGPAWEPIYNYITLLQRKVDKDNIHMHLYTNPAQGYLPDEVLKRADALFDEAESRVKQDDELLERVRVARLPLTYARVFPRNGYTIENGLMRFQGEIAKLPEVRDFVDRLKKHGFNEIRELGGDPKQMYLWSMALNTPMEVVTLANESLSAEIVPFLGGRILRIIDKKSGQCATAWNTTRNLMFPFCGGEEIRTGGTFFDMAASNFGQFVVREKSGNAARLTLGLPGDMTLSRSFRLSAGAPVIEIETKVSNTGDKPREIQLRSHLELDLGALTDTRVQFTSRNGNRIDKDMKAIIAGLREGEHYLDQNAPKGSWTFTGPKGLKVTQAFNDSQIDFTWVYAYPDYLNDLEAEVWAKPVTVGPKESVMLSNRLEITAP